MKNKKMKKYEELSQVLLYGNYSTIDDLSDYESDFKDFDLNQRLATLIYADELTFDIIFMDNESKKVIIDDYVKKYVKKVSAINYSLVNEYINFLFKKNHGLSPLNHNDYWLNIDDSWKQFIEEIGIIHFDVSKLNTSASEIIKIKDFDYKHIKSILDNPLYKKQLNKKLNVMEVIILFPLITGYNVDISISPFEKLAVDWIRIHDLEQDYHGDWLIGKESRFDIKSFNKIKGLVIYDTMYTNIYFHYVTIRQMLKIILTIKS